MVGAAGPKCVDHHQSYTHFAQTAQPLLPLHTTHRYLLLNGCGFDGTLCASAALGGHLSLLRGLRRRQFPWDTRTTAGAARGGHLAVLKWARAHGCRWKLKALHEIAVAKGKQDVLEWVDKLWQREKIRIMCRANANKE